MNYFLLVETDLTPEDPRWVGAWWLGFVILGSGAIITSVPTFFFPAGRKPPGQMTKPPGQMTKPPGQMTINNSDKMEESNDESCCSYFKGKFYKSKYNLLRKKIERNLLYGCLVTM